MVAERDAVEFMVYRLDPAKDKEACYVVYDVPVRPGMTVLDGLIHIQRELDPTLSVRYSCRFKICGS